MSRSYSTVFRVNLNLLRRWFFLELLSQHALYVQYTVLSQRFLHSLHFHLQAAVKFVPQFLSVKPLGYLFDERFLVSQLRLDIAIEVCDNFLKFETPIVLARLLHLQFDLRQ